MKYLILMLLLAGLIACMPPTNNKIELDGSRWILKTLNDHELQTDTAVTLKFDAGNIFGWTGCNFYGAKYTIQPNNGLTIGEGSVTEMECPESEKVMEQENEYLSAFWSVTSYKIDGEMLSLADEQGRILLQYQLLPRFEPDPEHLLGKTWYLKSATGLEETAFNEFTLQFDKNRLYGTTACRDYEGAYRIDGDSMNVPYMGMTTDVTCAEKDLIAEGKYTTLLGNVWQYNVSPTQLELFTVDGEKLIFR
jgi:heat shock protein HslJ